MWELRIEAPALVPQRSRRHARHRLISCSTERAAEPRGKPELVAAGDEDPGCALEHRGPFRLIGMVAIVDEGDVGGCGRRIRGRFALYRSPAVSIDEAVGMITIRALDIPASVMNVESIARSRNLSSAPPIAMTGPGLPVGSVVPHAVACL